MYYFATLLFSFVVAVIFLCITMGAKDNEDVNTAIGSTVMTLVAGLMFVWSVIKLFEVFF